jgi:hypothetical protein
MTYAEAVKILDSKKGIDPREIEALAVLRRAEPLVSAVEGADMVGVKSYYDDVMKQIYGDLPMREGTWDFEIDIILRTALAYKEKANG